MFAHHRGHRFIFSTIGIHIKIIQRDVIGHNQRKNDNKVEDYSVTDTSWAGRESDTATGRLVE